MLTLVMMITPANFIHIKDNEVLSTNSVFWQASDEDIRSCIAKDRENNGRFVYTVYEVYKVSENK